MVGFTPILSATWLKHTPISRLQKDFNFLVRSAVYSCPAILADFLSPVISRLHWADASLTDYVGKTNDLDHFFPSFLSFAAGSPVMIDEMNNEFFLRLSKELGNSELYWSVLDPFQPHFTLSTALDQISDSGFPDFSSGAAIAFLAFNFDRLSPTTLNALSFGQLSAMISSDSLKIASEDSLYDTITSRAPTDSSYFELLPFVRFEFLSAPSMRRVIEWISGDLSGIASDLWSAVSRRLLFPVIPGSMNPHSCVEIECP
jgi:hypothetical protein